MAALARFAASSKSRLVAGARFGAVKKAVLVWAAAVAVLLPFAGGFVGYKVAGPTEDAFMDIGGLFVTLLWPVLTGPDPPSQPSGPDGRTRRTPEGPLHSLP